MKPFQKFETLDGKLLGYDGKKTWTIAQGGWNMPDLAESVVPNLVPILTSAIPALVETLAKRGARPFTVTLSTCPKFLKKARNGNQLLPDEIADVRKVSVINCFLNFDYGKAVNRQREREEKVADFQAKPAWFKHTDIKAIVMHKESGELYLQLKVERIMSVEYVAPNGKRWEREQFEETYGDYLPTKAKPSGSQALEKPILTMTPSLHSILAFNVDGQTYVVGKEIARPNNPSELLAMMFDERDKALPFAPMLGGLQGSFGNGN